MPTYVASRNTQSGQHTPNLWKEAYKALCDDEQGGDRLHRLNKKLREEIGQPTLDLRSEDGYKYLLALINAKSRQLPNNNSSPTVANICNNMVRIKDLVGASAGVGGPYVAIPAAALFLAFSMQEMYQNEKDTMFRLAESVTHYTVLSAKCHDLVKITTNDDKDMRNLRETLQIVCVGLYKAILSTSTQLANFLYSDWKRTKLLLGTYDWKDQLDELNQCFELYVQYRNELDSRQKKPTAAPKKYLQKARGPEPRNPLHWAVELEVPERVNELVSRKEFPINALTPGGRTAAHLAARHGNTNIMKTLLTADGIDLTIKEQENGHTPLHVSALHNTVGTLKLLLQRDPKVLQIQDDRGRTAFLLAAQKGNTKVLEVLKGYGQNLNEALAAEKRHADILKWLRRTRM